MRIGKSRSWYRLPWMALDSRRTPSCRRSRVELRKFWLSTSAEFETFLKAKVPALIQGYLNGPFFEEAANLLAATVCALFCIYTCLVDLMNDLLGTEDLCIPSATEEHVL